MKLRKFTGCAIIAISPGRQEDRGHQRIALSSKPIATMLPSEHLVDEKTKTFIWTAHTENLGLSLVNWLADDDLIYVSEMDGWRHLYLD